MTRNYGDTMTILEDVKSVRGIQNTNTGFDAELLIHINSVKSELVQLGVDVFEDYVIDDTTEWPVFPNDTLEHLIIQYFGIKVGLVFDPIPSDTIQRTFDRAIERIEGRIVHEAAELAAL